MVNELVKVELVSVPAIIVQQAALPAMVGRAGPDGHRMNWTQQPKTDRPAQEVQKVERLFAGKDEAWRIS